MKSSSFSNEHRIIKKKEIGKKSEIKFSGYTGNFYFGFVTIKNPVSKSMEKSINFFRPIFEILPKRTYARYMGVISVKN